MVTKYTLKLFLRFLETNIKTFCYYNTNHIYRTGLLIFSKRENDYQALEMLFGPKDTNKYLQKKLTELLLKENGKVS